jgi:hydroxyacyl-ACP dehydratase HTD2-like protein with hotdog domain
VHGPLNLISMLDYWRDICGQGALGEISYRAMSPLYAGDEYQIRTSTVTDAEKGKLWELLVEKDGVTCMKGTIQG